MATTTQTNKSYSFSLLLQPNNKKKKSFYITQTSALNDSTSIHCIMSDSSETIQEIAFKLMLEQNKNDKILNGTTERTIFVLGSKGVVR